MKRVCKISGEQHRKFSIRRRAFLFIVGDWVAERERTQVLIIAGFGYRLMRKRVKFLINNIQSAN